MKSISALQDEGWAGEVIEFATVLDADGYDLELEQSEAGVRAQVSARSDACEDCLVPKAVFAAVLAKACDVDVSRVTVTYPDGA